MEDEDNDDQSLRGHDRRRLGPGLPNLLLLLAPCLALPPTSSSMSPPTVTVDLGERAVLSCTGDPSSPLPSPPSSSGGDLDISWHFSGSHHLRLNTSHSQIGPGGDLTIETVTGLDVGEYTCIVGHQVVSTVRLEVREVPSRVSNMTVHTNTVFAVVTWSGPGSEQGLPVLGHRCQHRADTSHLPHPQDKDLEYSVHEVPGGASLCSVYHLLPNTTYYFRVAAYNRLGQGEWVSAVGVTKPLVRSLGLGLAQGEGGGGGGGGGYARVLAVSLSVSVLALVTLGSGIALLLVRRGKPPPTPLQEQVESSEELELVPHITLNPSFNIDMLEHLGEQESSEHAFLVDHGGAGG